jgi:hypothetical protein
MNEQNLLGNRISEIIPELHEYESKFTYVPFPPPTSVIPSLQRFKSAPYKFSTFLILTEDENKIFVFKDEEEGNFIVAFTKHRLEWYANLYLCTRHRKNLYRVQLSVLDDLPPNLGAWSPKFIVDDKHGGIEGYLRLKDLFEQLISSSDFLKPEEKEETTQ